MLPRGQAGIRALAAAARHHRAGPSAAGVAPRFAHPTSTAPTLARLGIFHARFNSTTGKNDGPNTQPPSVDSENIPSDPKKLTEDHKKHHKWRYSSHGELNPDFSDKHPWVAGCLRLAISTAIGVLVVGGILLIHDASTYSERHVGRVPVNPLSLHPRRGGPKNLPIIEVNIDDEEDEQKRAMKDKPRLVILGGGWGAVSVLQSLPSDAFNVTVISPENYFCFTPLLPSACVGTVEPRSLVEPVRRIVARCRGHFLAGQAINVDMTDQLVEVKVPKDDEDGFELAYVPYDKLVVAVGSKSNTHGVKGLEYAYQLKRISDAQAIRRKILDNLEAASLPTTTPEERRTLLSFVVCGGGPTGVEFAAEVADMLSEEALLYYPKLLRNEVTISLIQSRDHILNTYSEKISEYAEKKFARSEITVHTNARVSEITPDSVIITLKGPDKTTSTAILPSGLTLWSTGIAMQDFTHNLVDQLPNQFHSKALQVDGYLRVEGAPLGTMYAIGDASTIHLGMMNELLSLWDRFDANKDNKLDIAEWESMAKFLSKKYPLASTHLDKIREVFEEFDKDHDNYLSLNEAADMFMTVTKRVTALPATAQVASQEGEYLGKMFSELSKVHRKKTQDGAVNPDWDTRDDASYFHPFKYRYLGSLASLGSAAVFDRDGFSLAGGLMAMYAWRSIYWSQQTSMRTRFMLMLDWVKRGLFGRDLSRF